MKGLDFRLGALGALAMVMDYAAVALLVGFMVLGRRLHLHSGTELDFLFILVIAFGTIVWLAGSRLNTLLIRRKPVNREPSSSPGSGNPESH